MKTFAARLTALTAAAALAAGAPASAAVQAKPASYNPWVALSAFASQSSSAALCGSAATAAAASATAQQAGTPGCVLPQVDAPAPVVTETVSPVAPVATSAGIGTLPLLLGLAALAGIGALFLAQGNQGGDSIGGRPLSP